MSRGPESRASSIYILHFFFYQKKNKKKRKKNRKRIQSCIGNVTYNPFPRPSSPNNELVKTMWCIRSLSVKFDQPFDGIERSSIVREIYWYHTKHVGQMVLYRGYYTLASRYGFYLEVLRTISYEWSCWFVRYCSWDEKIKPLSLSYSVMMFLSDILRYPFS